MKKLFNIRLQCLFAAVLLLFISNTHSQNRLYQKKTTAKYVLTSIDTVISPYIQGSNIKGVITNESESVYMDLWFAKTDSSSLDSSSYVSIAPKTKLRFETRGKKIFRIAQSDSVFSQVIFGDNVDIGTGGSSKQAVQTANEEGGAVTLNSTEGIVTVMTEGGASRSITLSNSFIKSTSLIIMTLEVLDVGDCTPSSVSNFAITGISAGALNIVVYKTGITGTELFTANTKIHFKITN